MGFLPESRRCLVRYRRRWRVEEPHKAQKMGCAIEQPQFTTASRLVPAIVSLAAVERLRVRNAARPRETLECAALEHFPALYVDVFAAWRHRALSA